MSMIPFPGDSSDHWPMTSRRLQDPIGYGGFPYMAPAPRWSDPLWPSMRRDPSPWMKQARERFLEMERRFDHFMAKVDGRFSGMLSLVDLKEDLDTNLPIQVQHEGKPSITAKDESRRGYYRMDINVQDFKPEEVTVKVDEGKVMVHAKRESKNEDNGMYAYTFREFKRAFTLPTGMKTEDVKSSLSGDGILKIEGPHDVSKEQLCLTGEIPVKVDHKGEK